MLIHFCLLANIISRIIFWTSTDHIFCTFLTDHRFPASKSFSELTKRRMYKFILQYFQIYEGHVFSRLFFVFCLLRYIPMFSLPMSAFGIVFVFVCFILIAYRFVKELSQRRNANHPERTKKGKNLLGVTGAVVVSVIKE